MWILLGLILILILIIMVLIICYFVSKNKGICKNNFDSSRSVDQITKSNFDNSVSTNQTAKKNFDKLTLTNQITPEITREECELKMQLLQSCKITFAIWWLIFWSLFGFGIGFGICLIIGFSNLSIRMTYKKQELTRLQSKINNLTNQEIANKIIESKSLIS